MRKLRELILRFGGLFNKRSKDRELDDEIESNTQMHIEDNLRLGMTPEGARRQAMMKLGGIESTKEAYRDQRGLPVLETLWQDIRYGVRMLRKNPGFTTVTVLTLALGIGANTAVFSVIERVLLRPLPYNQSHQLVMIRGAESVSISPPNFLDYEAQNHVFEQMATFNAGSRTLTEVDEPERIRTGLVTPGFFEILGTKPILGRTFLADEGKAGRNHVVVLSHSLWERRFGSNLNIVGQAIPLDDEMHIVVGVLPASFSFSVPGIFRPAEMWAPSVLSSDSTQRGNAYLRVIARLRPSVTLQQAQKEVDVITQRLAHEYLKHSLESRLELFPSMSR